MVPNIPNSSQKRKITFLGDVLFSSSPSFVRSLISSQCVDVFFSLCSNASLGDLTVTNDFFLRFFRSKLEIKLMQRIRPSQRSRRFIESGRNPASKVFQSSWISRVHFTLYPIFTLGNWIPRVLSQWFCSGHNCGFDQIVLEDDQGNVPTKYTKPNEGRYVRLLNTSSARLSVPQVEMKVFGMRIRGKSKTL